MAISTGIAKQLRYKKEASWGVAPGATGAQLLRRVTSDLNLLKDAYESAEIRSDYQVADYRHGARRIEGAINGELSLGTWQDFLAAALRKAWAVGGSAAAMTVSSDATAKTFTRAAGSWITDGFRVGDVVRYAGYTAGNVGMNGVNYRIVALTATVMTVGENTGMVTAASVAGISCSTPGKKVYAPLTGHTNDSFYIEHWHADVSQSEAFAGCRVGDVAIALPSSGMATINVGLLGKDLVSGGAAYYTSPTAETTTAVMAAVNGKLRVGSSDLALVTSMSLNLQGGMSVDTVIGSNTTPDVFAGRVRVNGQMTAYFENGTLRDAFANESELSTHVLLNADGTTTGGFMSIFIPRIKLGSATKDDGEKGLIQTIDFTALLPAATTGYDQSTIVIQDSSIA